MVIKPKNVRRYQAGGPMPAEDPAMAEDTSMAPEGGAPEQGGGDPLVQLASVFAQGLQNQDCEMLAQGAQMFLQLVQQAQGGAPAGPEQEPVFRKGGVLVRKISRK